MEHNFGSMIKLHRESKKLPVDPLIELLKAQGCKISRAYVTKVELHDEIPSKETVIALCLVLDVALEPMLELAKQGKMDKYKKILDKKYAL